MYIFMHAKQIFRVQVMKSDEICLSFLSCWTQKLVFYLFRIFQALKWISYFHIAQGYSLRIAHIVNGVHGSKLRVTFQLGVNYLILWRVKSFDCCRANWNAWRWFIEQTFHTEVRNMISRAWGLEYEVPTFALLFLKIW